MMGPRRLVLTAILVCLVAPLTLPSPPAVGGEGRVRGTDDGGDGNRPASTP